MGKFVQMKIRLEGNYHRNSIVAWLLNIDAKTYHAEEKVNIPKYVLNTSHSGIHINEMGFISYFTSEESFIGSRSPEYGYDANKGMVRPVKPILPPTYGLGETGGIDVALAPGTWYLPSKFEPKPKPHVHAVHLHDIANNPEGGWQYKYPIVECWSEWIDVKTGHPSFRIENLYRRKPVVPEREFPTTSLSINKLQGSYSNVGGSSRGLKAVADAVIKQYILDTEKAQDDQPKPELFLNYEEYS